MNKAATVEKYAQGIEWLRQYGIMTFGSFIIGFPGETRQTVDETIQFIRQCKPDHYRVQMWCSKMGTPIQNQRDQYNIEGEGFVWSHNTMDSLEAMDQIDRVFLTVKESLWLQQWSFDFWTVPYLIGRHQPAQFKELMTLAHKLLALEIASVRSANKSSMQQEYL
jgi:p-methyltransferase